MATTITKLYSSGILESSAELNEITYGSIKVSPTGIYASQFDEISLSTSTSERRTSTGTYMVSGYFDEYSPTRVVLNLDAGDILSYSGTGSTWYDLSYYQDATLLGSPTWNSGGFFTLNGIDQYANTNNEYLVSNYLFADTGGSWSVNAWFKFPVTPTQLRDNTVGSGNTSFSIVGRGGGIGGAETFCLFVGGTTTVYGVFTNLCFVGSRGAKTQISPTTVNTDTWNMATVTWNGSSGAVYWNGVYQRDLVVGTAALQAATNVTIGSQANGSAFHMFEGSISKVSIYNMQLTANQVLQNYQMLRGRYGV
jgi:hypothetical protein